MEWLRRHWQAFWRSGPENVYTFVWWSALTAIVAGVLYIVSWTASLPSVWKDRFLAATVALAFPLVATVLARGIRRAGKWVQSRNLQQQQSPGAQNVSKPITLRALFDSDFPNTHRVGSVLQVKESANEPQYEIPFRVCVDFEARSQFLMFYIGRIVRTRMVCFSIANSYKDTIRIANRMVGIHSMLPSDTAETQLKDVVFSGRIFIYHEYPMTLREMAELEDLFKQQGAAVQFRGPTYLALNMKGKRVRLL